MIEMNYYITILLVLIFLVVILGVWMRVANYIGDKIGIGRFLLWLWESMRSIFDKSKDDTD